MNNSDYFGQQWSGTVTDKYTYDAFGALMSKTGSTLNEFLYTGQQYDTSTGLYYLRARYYHTSTGRFITTDTYAGSLLAPMSLHKYSYTRNNPVNLYDPSGQWYTGTAELSTSSAISTTLMTTMGVPMWSVYAVTAIALLSAVMPVFMLAASTNDEDNYAVVTGHCHDYAVSKNETHHIGDPVIAEAKSTDGRGVTVTEADDAMWKYRNAVLDNYAPLKKLSKKKNIINPLDSAFEKLKMDLLSISDSGGTYLPAGKVFLKIEFWHGAYGYRIDLMNQRFEKDNSGIIVPNIRYVL